MKLIFLILVIVFPIQVFSTYSIQIFSTINEQKAKNIINELDDKNHMAFILKKEIKNKIFHRILIGKFNELNEAKKELNKIKKLYTNSFILKIDELSNFTKNDFNSKEIFINNKYNPNFIENVFFLEKIIKNKKPFLNIGHKSAVYNVFFNKNFILSQDDKNTKIWDRKTKKLIKNIKGDIQYFKLYFTKQDNKTIKIFTYENNLIKTIDNSLFSIHENTLVFFNKSNDIEIWDLKKKYLIGKIKEKEIAKLWVYEGSEGFGIRKLMVDDNVVVGIIKYGRIVTWNKKGELLYFKDFDFGYGSSIFDKNTIIIGGFLGDILILNKKSGKILKRISVGGGGISSIEIDNNLIVVGTCRNMRVHFDSNYIHILNKKTGKFIKSIKVPDSSEPSRNCVKSLTMSNKIIISGHGDNKIRIWDKESYKQLDTIPKNDNDFTNLYIVRNNKNNIVASGEDKNIDLWDKNNGKYLTSLLGHKDWVNALDIDKDIIVSGGWDSSLKIWSTNDGTLLKDLKGLTSYRDSRITDVLINKSTIIASHLDNGITIWDKKNYELLKHFDISERIYNIAEDKDNIVIYIATSSDEKTTLKRCSKKDGKCTTIKGGRYFLIGMENNIAVVIDEEDQLLKFIDIYSGSILKVFNRETELISIIRNNLNEKLLVVKENKNFKIFHISNMMELNKKNTFFEKILHFFNISNITQIPDTIIGFDDEGVIEIWNIKNNQLLASFIHFKDGEWITITPNGYFDASENGAKHLNVLTAPLKVTSVDAYYEKFYRPDIVKLALQGKIVDTGVKMSDIKPAPDVEIVGLPKMTTNKQIEVTLKLKDMGGGIGDIRIYRNGVAVNLESRTIQRSQKGVVTKRYIIPLEKGKNKIEAIAFESTNSAKSEPPATANIMANYTNHSKPTLHAVVVGIEEFRNQRLNLRYTKSDATALKKSLERYSKPLFKSVNVTLLTTKEETTKENISQVLTKMKSLNPNDMFLLFVASHGLVEDGDYYLITSNVGSLSKRKLRNTALSQAEITKLISNIPTSKKLIILDTCYSGALGDSIKVALLTRGMSEDTAIKILSRATGTTILSASLSTQQALEGYRGHGLFSYVLLEGLKKEADLNGDGYVKNLELVNYIEDRVPQISEKVFGVEQFPTAVFDGRGFPVTRVE